MSPSCRSVTYVPHQRGDRRLEAWEERENSMVAALPWVMLAFTTIATVVIRNWQGEPWELDLGLCAVTGVWMAAERMLPKAWRERAWIAGVYFTGLVILMAVLVVRDAWFGFFTFTGYFPAMRLRPAWARGLGVISVAALTGTSQAGGVPTKTLMIFIWIACVMINVCVAGGFTWFGWVSQVQNEKRKVLVTELRSANERLEATLAENAGLHQQLLTQAREAGALDERQRMAREIHDTLAQGLTGIITQLQAAEQASEDPAARRRHFDTATRLARDSLTEARRSVDALRPQPLERASLADALTSVADSWSALHGVAAGVTVTGTPCPIGPDTELALLRTAQESLANVAKHAEARRVGLTLSYMDDEVVLDVRDDGRGFDPARTSARSGAAASGMGASGTTGGFGLVAMRERVEALAGTLQVESAPGTGTAISACVPVRPVPSADEPAPAAEDSAPAAGDPVGELAGAGQ